MDFNYLGEYEVGACLVRANLKPLVAIKEIIYPRLVRAFYSNLEIDDSEGANHVIHVS